MKNGKVAASSGVVTEIVKTSGNMDERMITFDQCICELVEECDFKCL